MSYFISLLEWSLFALEKELYVFKMKTFGDILANALLLTQFAFSHVERNFKIVFSIMKIFDHSLKNFSLHPISSV